MVVCGDRPPRLSRAESLALCSACEVSMESDWRGSDRRSDQRLRVCAFCQRGARTASHHVRALGHQRAVRAELLQQRLQRRQRRTANVNNSSRHWRNAGTFNVRDAGRVTERILCRRFSTQSRWGSSPSLSAAAEMRMSCGAPELEATTLPLCGSSGRCTE